MAHNGRGATVRYLNLIKNVSNWHVHLMQKAGINRDDPLLFTARNGVSFEVPKRLYHEFKEIFMENAYSIGLKKKLSKNPVILDIGANVGFFTMFAISQYPGCTIYSYEPIAANFVQLVRNRELNSAQNIQCVNKAVCGYCGAVTMNYDETDAFTTSATIVGSNSDTHAIEIECVALADIFHDHSIEYCDLLKLDCEGAEYDILYNAPKELLGRIDQMAIEMHGGRQEGETPASLKRYLSSLGFCLFQYADKPHMLWVYRS